MKTLQMYFIVMLTLSAALPVFAGPDFPRPTHKASEAKQADCMPKTYTLANGKTLTCPPHELVLPLDHGHTRPQHPTKINSAGIVMRRK